jgi:hypothetical protein
LVTLYMVVRFSAVHSNVSPPISLSLSSRSSFFFLLFCERFGAALTEAWPPFFLAVGGSWAAVACGDGALFYQRSIGKGGRSCEIDCRRRLPTVFLFSFSSSLFKERNLMNSSLLLQIKNDIL